MFGLSAIKKVCHYIVNTYAKKGIYVIVELLVNWIRNQGYDSGNDSHSSINLPNIIGMNTK